MRVVCVGLATVDLIQVTTRFPGPDEKVQAESAEFGAGGPALNAAVTAAALGASVTLVSAVGAHPVAGLIHTDLHRYGVSLLDATPGGTAPPPVSAVTVLAGTGRRSVVSRNAGADVAGVPAGFDQTLATADAVLIDGHHPVLAAAAAAAGRPVVVDAGSWRPVFAEVIPRATVVACSAQFRPPDARDGTGTAVTAAVRELGARHGAITHGPEPITWWSGGGEGALPVPAVPAVDTTGAGDAFHGALAVALARDPGVGALEEMLRFAAGVAGVRVRHPGPRSWLAALPPPARADGP